MFPKALPVPLKIDSQRDPLARLLQSLTTPTGRVQNGQYLVEGAELIRRAFAWGAEVKALLLSDAEPLESEDSVALRKLAAERRMPVHVITAGLLAKMLGAKPTPPSVAVLTRRVVGLESLVGESRLKTSLLVVADSMENADNLGMFLRSTEAAGVDGVILTGDTAEPFNRKTVRGSRGAVYRLRLCVEPDGLAVIRALRAAGHQVVATSARGPGSYTELDYTTPTAILVGNEHIGLSAALCDEASALVRIPMAGEVSSLNVAVAASVMLYEAVRQRAAAQWRAQTHS